MSKHVLIIGAGVIGLCTGFYLTERGYRVSIVDQAEMHHEGCSYGNAGMVVPSHFVPLAAPGMISMAARMMLSARSPFYIKPRLDRGLFNWSWKFWRAANARHVARAAPLLRDLNMAGRACYEELSALPHADFGFTKNGLLMLCKTRHGWDEERKMAGQAHRLGIPAQVLTSAEAQALEPAMTMDIAGAVYFPMDCHLSPGRLMDLLRRKLAESGATFRWNAEVVGWRANGPMVQAVLLAGGEEMSADEYVLCGGSWSETIVRDLGLRLPMQPGKGYSLTLPNPPSLPRLCAILTEARVAMTPMDGRLRFGGTMEMSGLNHRIVPARVEGIIRSIPAYFPDIKPGDFAGVKPWCGLRPCTPDGLPYLGRTRRYSNLAIATGHAMMGLSLGAISGKLIAGMIAGEKAGIDLAMMEPDRYG